MNDGRNFFIWLIFMVAIFIILVVLETALEVPDIGTAASGNTDTYFPIWIRIYCPGNTSPIIKTDFSIKVSYVESVVQVPL